MTAQVYRRPEADGFATLVVDFTPLPDAVVETTGSSLRGTSSSRGSGRNVGVVYFELVPRKNCPDCGRVVNGRCQPGRHAPVGTPAGMVNCVGKRIEVWP